MASTTAHTGSPLECDYLRSCTPLIPHVFTSKQAEWVHVSEQIRLLDDHISQLNTLRSALHDHSCQLSPINSLPTEILSCIFQEATEREVYNRPKFQQYRRCLRQAFVLSSVSTHFRHVAFGTPELWRRIPLKMTVGGEMGRLASLLQHCTTFAHIIDISVEGRFDDEEAARSAIETPGLFTCDVMGRLKSFELSSPFILDVWQPILKGSNFPTLDNLRICGPALAFDLGTLRTVTRLEIRNEFSDILIIMPPSIRYLFLEDVGPHAFVSMLFRCPKLEECLVYDSGLYDDEQAAQFDEPLTLTRLKRLTLLFINAGAVIMPLLAQKLRLPSLGHLQLKRCSAGEFDGCLLFCQNVSATLTTLKLQLFGRISMYHLRRLCRLSFPNLRQLGIAFSNTITMRDAVYALTKRAAECSEDQMHYLPSLAALNLRYDDYDDDEANEINEMILRGLVSLLEKWRVGEMSYFHLRIKGLWCYGGKDRSLEVEEELRSIVGNRQIGITWNGRKVH